MLAHTCLLVEGAHAFGHAGGQAWRLKALPRVAGHVNAVLRRRDLEFMSAAGFGAKILHFISPFDPLDLWNPMIILLKSSIP